MPLDLGDLTFMRITADATTPNEYRVYDGFMLGLTADKVAALPTGIDTITVDGITVPGYKRTVSGQLQWLMTPLPDPNVAMLDTLPRPAGWVNQSAKQVWANIGMELLRRGVPGPDLRAGFPALFNAARTEIQAGG
jgi:hypothetical protein